MKTFCFVIAIAFFLSGCRSKTVAVESVTAGRSSDSVAALRSRSAIVARREVTVERIVMRPDTSGVLKVTEHDITRRTENTTQTAQSGDTADFHAEARQEAENEAKTLQTRQNEAETPVVTFLAGIRWGAALLAAALAIIFLSRWRYAHS